MAFADDVVNGLTAQIVSIGLSTSSSAAGEVSGGGYAVKTPTYASSSGGTADITSALQFNGPANSGPVTHLIYRKASGVWVIDPVTTPLYFNSDGRLDVTSAPVSATLT